MPCRTGAVRRSDWENSGDRKMLVFGGERGIRTLEGLLTLTPLAGVRLRPLGHLSDLGKLLAAQALRRGTGLPAKKGAHDTATGPEFPRPVRGPSRASAKPARCCSPGRSPES